MVLAVSCLTSCDVNCIIPMRPELNNGNFEVGNTDSYYYAEVRAEIDNEPRDNAYDYFFDVSGLPPGLDIFVNNRTLSIEGQPTQAGTFDIVVNLYVEGPFYNDFEDATQLCENQTSRTYTIIIEDL